MIRAGWWHCLLVVALLLSVMAGRAENAPEPASDDAASAPSPAVRGILAEASERIRVLDYPGADKLLLDGIARHPDAMPLWHLLAANKVKQNQYDEAVSLLERLLTMAPDDHRLMNNMSWLFSTATDQRYRNPKRALQLAQDAILIAPGDYHLWSTLAEAHFVNGNFRQAYRVMLQCLSMARTKNAPAASIRSYQSQLNKIQEAHSVMSLLE